MNADEEGDGGDDALEAARNGLITAPRGVLSFAIPMTMGKPLAFIGG
jgi:hypothetical protein